MVLKTGLQRSSKKLIPLFSLAWLLFVIQSVSAQNQVDTAKVTLLASLEKKATPLYLTRASNIIFPDILKGNEDEMLPYIEKFSTEKRDYLTKMYNRGKSFLPKAASILKKYDLPQELNILLVLESEYKANVISRAGAVGYWQIMDATARTYGMKYISRMTKAAKENLIKLNEEKGISTVVVKQKDDRKNFNRATHAAARFLRDSKQYVDDNLLMVVASYNCGVGRVRKAIKRAGKTNPSFWEIKKYLPGETRAYVMNFITLNVIFNNYELFATNKLSFSPEKIIVEDLEKNIIETTSE